MRSAVLVMAYGGPDSLDDIEPYLLDIRGGRATSPELIEEIRERYARIGGRSPLLGITLAQAQALEQALNAHSNGSYQVYVGMRHWKPYIRDVVAQIAADGFQHLLAFCMAPHASKMSTGAYYQRLQEALAAVNVPAADLPAADVPELKTTFIETWYDQPFLVQALAGKVRSALEQFAPEERGQVHYLFTAHSLPAAIMQQGDPYQDQLLHTTRLLAEELGLPEGQFQLAYQSAGAAGGRWLGPSVEEVLAELAAAGKKNVMVTPIGFMADHVEILFDLDIEAQEVAGEHGIRLVRSQSLNVSPDFIEGLAQFLLKNEQHNQLTGQNSV